MNAAFEEFMSRFPVTASGLANAVKTGRRAHAYLITGDRRPTLDLIEKVIAALVSCREAAASGRPCGRCRSCADVASGAASDCVELTPSGRAGMIKIGDPSDPEPNTVRWFMNRLSLSASEPGATKVGIIRDADRMNTEAQNALLKTLEEPPPDTVLILSSLHPEKLLPTTRSRCQVVPAVENYADFDFPEAAELRKCLYRLFNLEPGDIARGFDICKSVIALTAALLEDEQKRAAESSRPVIEQLRENDPSMAKRLIARSEDAALGEYRGKRGRFLALICSFFAALLLRAEGLPNFDAASEALLDGFAFGRIDPAAARRALEASEELERVLRFNINENIAWYNWMLRITVPPTMGR